ncbi:MAG: hypothetical protein ACUVSL_14180 [Chloroflexus sp.]|uniref:hypothetical protein n=1 Tax=Chloroflexus sp. TaxID=1904827 RepID=UPI0040498811
MKANQPELLEALEEWIDFWSQQRGNEVAHRVEVVKRHGRMERREGWMVPYETDMHAYLRDEFGWPGVQWCGRIRRQRWTPEKGEEEGIQVWVAEAAFPWSLDIQTAARSVRGHWTMENRVFSVQDVTMDEDRRHRRQIGPALRSIRNVTLSLMRLFFPGRSLPDAIRLVRALPDGGFSLLTASLLQL